MLRKIVVFFMAALVFSGCSMRLTDFTVMSSKNIDLSQLDTFKRGKGRVEGKDSALTAIGFLPTFMLPKMKAALDRAIESTPGAIGLVDGVVYRESFWLIFGTDSFIVKGTPLIDPALVSKAN